MSCSLHGLEACTETRDPQARVSSPQRERESRKIKSMFMKQMQ